MCSLRNVGLHEKAQFYFVHVHESCADNVIMETHKTVLKYLVMHLEVGDNIYYPMFLVYDAYSGPIIRFYMVVGIVFIFGPHLGCYDTI